MPLKLGFAKTDITPRVGVELCGFGPFLNRHSVGVHDPLYARAMAVQTEGKRVVIIACDLIGIDANITGKVRGILAESSGLDNDETMIWCSHTHSGPNTAGYIGWGEPDPPYLEVLPHRIADAAERALVNLQPAQLHHATVPCEGIGINREYEEFWASDDALQSDWRPDKPELTDTTCHVLAGRRPEGTLLGFAAYFGCHPVVCGAESRMIHGDYPGVALNDLQREHEGAVGLFLQGAQGDVNTAIGGQPQEKGLAALDEIANRFAGSIERGLAAGQPIAIDEVCTGRQHVTFTRKNWDVGELRRRLSDAEKVIAHSDNENRPSDSDHDTRLNTVYAIALRRLLKRAGAGRPMAPSFELHGVRLGPIAFLGGPFETFQAIKNDVTRDASAPIPLVGSFVNDSAGYAVDRQTAQNGGYAAEMVPLICEELPFADVHSELVEGLLKLDQMLTEAGHIS